MKAIEPIGDIDEQHRLQARVLPDEDPGGIAWEHAVAKEWAAEWVDPREDINTLEDGQLVNAPR